MSSVSNITPPIPATFTVAGSALTPTVASSHAATPASDCTAPIKEETPLHPSSAALMAASLASSGSALEQHQDIYFRLKATSASDAGTHKFSGASRLCASLLAHLSNIPCLAETGLFSPGNIRLTISKHHSHSTKCFLYTASFVKTGALNTLSEASITVTDLILKAQLLCADERKSPSAAKSFIFELPTVTPNGNSATNTHCSFSYDRETLLGLTTIDFQVKIPSAVSISPQEDFALLICQLYTPRGNLSEAEFMTLTRTDRARFAKCCTPRKAVSTKHGDWMDEIMFGTFSLNFEDADSRDSLIWNFLMFAVFFGLDPRFGHHQQYQLFIPTLHDLHQLERRPAVMRDAVKSFKANQAISDLLPAKPRRIRPKGSDASSSDTEGEALFLDNILRRSEAILLLKEVSSFDSLASLHFPPLNDAPFTHVLQIPQAPVTISPASIAADIPPVNTAALGTISSASTAAGIPPLKTAALDTASASIIPRKPWSAPSTIPPALKRVECMSWNLSSSCKHGAKCKFLHKAADNDSLEFIGEGKRDKACIKFSQNRCHRGDRCLYKHDLRNGISSQLQALSLMSPSTSAKVANRAHMASPARGTIQLASFLNALENALPNGSLRESLFASNPLLTSLVTLAPIDACARSAAFLQIASPPCIPPLAALIQIKTQSPLSASSAFPTLAQPPRRIKVSSPTLLEPRVSRSLPPSNIGALEGFCTQGHKIFKRTPSKNGFMRRCSFCKSHCEGYTCFCGTSHSCLQCLIDHKTAPPPPPCAASFCTGICAIQALTHISPCWNGGHSLKKGSEAWQCKSCKFTICRSCSLKANTPGVALSTPPTLPPPEAVGSSESSATASAPVPP
jgi:hypothetical protein